MNLSTLLEVGISLIFVFLLGSILVSNLNELWVASRNQRGRLLLRAIESVLNDGRLNKNFAHLLYMHPQVERTRQTRKRWPAYIAPRIFAQTLIDLIGEEGVTQQAVQDPATLRITVHESPGDDEPLERFRAGVAQLHYSDLKVLLRSFERQSHDYASLAETIESWYEDYMDRVTGWYKQGLRWQLMAFGALVTVALNLDTITLTRALWGQSLLRAQVVQAASAFIENNKDSLRTTQDVRQNLDTLKSTYEQLTQLQLPIGWHLPKTLPAAQTPAEKSMLENIQDELRGVWAALSAEVSAVGWWPKLLGWLITSIALTFGAPFWFDVLRYVVNVRQAGIKPQPRPKPPVS